MRAAWRGPAVEVVAETEARDTVENATLSLPLLRDRGVDRLDVVCAASHAPRVRALLPAYFARHGIAATCARSGSRSRRSGAVVGGAGRCGGCRRSGGAWRRRPNGLLTRTA